MAVFSLFSASFLAVILFVAEGCAKHLVVTRQLGGCIANEASALLPVAGVQHGPIPSGAITSVFDGFGCNSLATRDGVVCLHLRPKAAAVLAETHAGLVLGPKADGDLKVSCGVLTAAQIRSNSAPQEHEVGWLIWHYVDNDHFYYLAAKPNGWELGKRDPAFRGGQRFLATDNASKYPVGERHELRVSQVGNRIEAAIDGQTLPPFVDQDHPYTKGSVAFYCEDSDVFFDSVEVEPGR